MSFPDSRRKISFVESLVITEIKDDNYVFLKFFARRPPYYGPVFFRS